MKPRDPRSSSYYQIALGKASRIALAVSRTTVSDQEILDRVLRMLLDAYDTGCIETRETLSRSRF